VPARTDEDFGSDPQLDEILAKYLQAAEAGEPLDKAQLLLDHPAYANQLRQFFADKSRIDRVIGAVESGESPNIPGDAPTLPPTDTNPLEAPTLGAQAESNAASRLGAMMRYFGDYELLNEIARGGMGVVY
jgi:serine/threonine-protein kinase